jgi:hypothetical protein
MSYTPDEFNEFWSLINTTAQRQSNAYNMKKKGYIPLATDTSPKPKPIKRKRKKGMWDDKIKAYNDKVAERNKINNNPAPGV